MSPFDSSPQTSHSNSNNSTSPSGGGGDVLLKWGQKKRSRVSRTLNIEDSSSSVHTNQRKNFSAKFSSASMPPPPPLVSSSSSTISNGRVRKHNSPRSAEQKLSTCIERSNKRMPSTKCTKKQNGTSTTKTTNHVDTNGEKVSVEVIQLPKIYISLSRKEKEDDFLAMKGTKIPQRPKKRAKNIDRTLQYCFPGMWLSDLTKSRYEVREKKSVKKQKCSRGLKGMESLESDSE
ncbi:unnamed protein product [Trifolium pratense]|uniref:Uncharacterized protein n=1 Tax=Trifolium pratense TaxID=57577 RepID=A0ACB0IW40_TRIPR|nr:unnamed protein product [Trifolium pratense]